MIVTHPMCNQNSNYAIWINKLTKSFICLSNLSDNFLILKSGIKNGR